jgi:hypothetical protein
MLKVNFHEILYFNKVSLSVYEISPKFCIVKLWRNFISTLTAGRKNDPVQCPYSAFLALWRTVTELFLQKKFKYEKNHEMKNKVIKPY